MHTKIITSLLAASASTACSQDVRPPIKNATNLPLHYGILLHPSVTPIDLFGPLDVFTGLAMYYTNQTKGMQLSVLSANSTPATTNPPLPGLDFGFALPPTVTFDEYRSKFAKNATNSTARPLDVLLVPGGGGARADVTKEIAFVKEVYPELKYIISVCTGSTIIARAGVLDGKNATTNKKAWTWATSFGKGVKYHAQARWVVDGNTWTGSGVSAAVDTAYAFLAKVYGEDVSQWIADASEYTRWTNKDLDPFADRWGAKDVETK